MMEMKEQTGSRKKLLVPVVVLMLCLVALTGAAYAYSATMTNSANNLEADYISIDLSTPATPTSSIIPGDSLITFTDNFTYSKQGNPAAWVRGDRIDYELTDPAVLVKYKVTIDGTADFTKFNVSSTDLESKVLFGSKTVDNLFDIKYTVKSLDESSTIIAATALGTAAAKGTMAAGNTYVVIISAVAVNDQENPAEGTVANFPDMSQGETHTASYYQAAVNALAYTLVFELNNDA